MKEPLNTGDLNSHADGLAGFYQNIYDQASRISARFIVGLFVFSLVFAVFHNTWLLAFGLGGSSVGLYFLINAFAPKSWSRYIISFVYGNFVLLYILQMQGLHVMYFSYFFALTLLLFFENWKVMLPLIFHSIVSSLILYNLQTKSTEPPAYLSNVQTINITSIALQIGFMLAYSALCILWARMQRKQTEESGMIQLKMNAQLKTMDVNISFADSISQGKLTADYPATETDRLGESLQNMRKSLIEASDREEKEKFLNVGLTEVGEILRKYADNLNQLCDHVIESLVKYVKATQGSNFIIDGQGQDEHLTLIASRAWDRKKFLEKRVELGQGLVGQAVLEKQTIFIKRVPENYITITSGLGQANPSALLIVPLKAEENVVGVIELASFKVFNETEIMFLEKVGESIASTILTTKNNQKNKELLESTKQLAEQLKSQEEEIRQNMEEMQATQEEMERKGREVEGLLNQSNEKERELKIKLEEIETIKKEEKQKSDEQISYNLKYRNTLLGILDQLPHKIFLKDKDGKMALVNTIVAKAHNMSIDELIGKSDFDFVDAKTAQDWRNQELEIIKKGVETYVFDETLHGETKTLKSTKMAFYIPHLDQTGLLGIQTDITEVQELKKLVEEAERLKSKK